MRDFDRFVDDLVRRRRPRPFRMDAADAPALAAAIHLTAGRPGADLPSEEFVARLHARLGEDFGAADAVRRTPATDGAAPAPTASGTRRRFLRGTAAVAASAAAGAAVSGHLAGQAASTGDDPAVIRPNHGSWNAVTSVADLPTGSVHPFQVGGLRGFVYRGAAGLVALSGVCTHQGCLLSVGAGSSRLDCPCHRTSFGLDGQVIEYQLAVRPRALARIEVRERDGRVEVFSATAEAAPSAPSTPEASTT